MGDEKDVFLRVGWGGGWNDAGRDWDAVVMGIGSFAAGASATLRVLLMKLM